jgi:hypothetical protein
MKDLINLTPQEFENLVFDLLTHLGLKNCVWRTPGSDGGKDIQGDYIYTDISGYSQKQVWYIECKRYTGSVDWPTVWNKISYAEAKGAEVLLIVTTSSLTPQAIDNLNEWNINKKYPSIRTWSGAELKNKLALFPEIQTRYELIPSTLNNSAKSFLPLIKVLLKFSYLVSSCNAFSQDCSSQIEALNCIADILSKRIEDLELYQRIIFYKFDQKHDGYEWLSGGQLITESGFDRYGIRAVLCCLRTTLKINKLNLEKVNNLLVVKEIKNCPQSLFHDLTTIGLWTNFRLKADERNFYLESTDDEF